MIDKTSAHVLAVTSVTAAKERAENIFKNAHQANIYPDYHFFVGQVFTCCRNLNESVRTRLVSRGFKKDNIQVLCMLGYQYADWEHVDRQSALDREPVLALRKACLNTFLEEHFRDGFAFFCHGWKKDPIASAEHQLLKDARIPCIYGLGEKP